MPKIVIKKQNDEEACGPTCIYMAIKSLGVDVDMQEIDKVSKYRLRGGLSNKELVNTLISFKCNVSEQWNTTWEKLKRAVSKKNSVVVVSWMMEGYIGHFSVVSKVGKNSIILADPLKGKSIKFPRIKFLRLWMDYDEMWYPAKNTDIQLRWMAVVTIK